LSVSILVGTLALASSAIYPGMVLIGGFALTIFTMLMTIKLIESSRDRALGLLLDDVRPLRLPFLPTVEELEALPEHLGDPLLRAGFDAVVRLLRPVQQ